MSSFSVTCPHCGRSAALMPNSLSNTPDCQGCQKPLLDGKPVEADANQLTRLIQSPKPVVVVFWGNQCTPCQTFKPIVDQVAAQHRNHYRFVRINLNKNKVLAQKYRIRGVPTILIFKKGKQQAALHTALRKNEFIRWLKDAIPA